jgi:hypothetical protein
MTGVPVVKVWGNGLRWCRKCKGWRIVELFAHMPLYTRRCECKDKGK